MYKLSAIEVDKTFRDSVPLENYSKMVLCRSCHVRSGTNFVTVPDDSAQGQLLKNIFKQGGNDKVCP